MVKGFNLQCTPEQNNNMIVEMLVDIYAKISSLQSFIIDHYGEENKSISKEELFKYFEEITDANRLEVIAGITKKFSL